MKSRLAEAGLLLGSNIEPELHLHRAMRELRGLLPVVKISNVWETPAVGGPGPNFLNAAILVHTGHTPASLKERVLRPLEARLGRVRQLDRNAARTIDIDIIAWGSRACDPLLWQHAHLAVPLAEILPDLRSPETGERLEQAARRMKKITPILLRADINLVSAAGLQPASALYAVASQ